LRERGEGYEQQKGRKSVAKLRRRPSSGGKFAARLAGRISRESASKAEIAKGNFRLGRGRD
jgi:hypothetical protein